MEELQKLYNVLSRDGYYSKSFDDFQNQFSDSAYQNKVFDVVSRDGLYTKDKVSFVERYGVKKKEEVGEEISEPSEKPSSLVSTPEQEFKTTEAIEAEAAFVPRVGEELLFQEEEEKQPVNYMGLFNKKEDFQSADESGVSLSFQEEASKAASQAERPVEYLFEASDIKTRLEELPKYFPQLQREVDVIKKNLPLLNSRNIETVRKQIQDLESQVYKPAAVATQYTYGAGGDPNWISYEENVVRNKNTLAGRSLLDDTEKLREISSLIGTTRGKIAKGAIEGLGSYVKGYAELTANLRGNRAVTDLREKWDKISNGEDVELTTDEKLLSKVLIDNMKAHSQLDDRIPSSYKIGESIGTSLGFMGEFVLTGGVGKAAAIGIRGLAGTSKLSRMGANVAAKIAQSGMQTAAMPTLYKGVAEDVSKGENFGTALLYNYWDTFAETMSERIFMANPASGKIVNGVDRMLARMGTTLSTEKGATGVFKSILEEATEEKIGEIITAPKDYDSLAEFWKGFTDKEQNKIMLGSVALMIGGMGAPVVVGDATSSVMNQVKMSKFKKAIPSDLRVELDIILDNKDLSVKQQYDLIGDVISDKIEEHDLGDNPTQVVADAMRYTQNKVQDIASETVEDSKILEGEEFKVGEVERVDTDQEKLDYLKEKGIDTPDGMTGDQLDKLYESVKIEEDKEVVVEAKGEEVVEKVKPKEKEDVKEKVQVKQVQKQDVQITEEVETKDEEAKRRAEEARKADKEEVQVEEKKFESEIHQKYHKKGKALDRVEYVPISEIDAYKEHDREIEKKFSKEELDNLEEKIKKDGGIKEPIVIQIDGDGKALVIEGNTRIAVAKRLGIKKIPVRVIEGEFGSINKHKAKKLDYNRAEASFRVRDKYEMPVTSPTRYGFTGDVIKPTEVEKKPVEPITPEKAVIVPEEEKVAEKARIDFVKQAKKEENKERLGRIFDNAAILTGVRKEIVGDERKKVRQQLIDDVIEYVKVESELLGQELVDGVKAFLKANPNVQVTDLKDEEIIKSKSYAEKIDEVRRVREEAATEKRREEGEPVRGVREEYRAEAPPKKEKGVTVTKKGDVTTVKTAESRFGVRYAFGEGFSEKSKEEYRKGKLFEYVPESPQEVVDIATSLMELNSIEDVATLFDSKELPKRIRTALGLMLADNYAQEAEKSLENGDTVAGDKFILKEQSVIQTIQKELAIEGGRDVAFFGSEFVTERMTPYKTAREVQLAMDKKADKVRKSRGYKKTKEVVQDELHKLRPRVLKEVGRQQRVQAAKKRAQRKTDTDPRKTKIKKEINELTDMLRVASKGVAGVSIIGLNSEQIEIGGKIAAKYIELGIINVKELIQKLKNEFKKAGVDITDKEAKSMIPEKDGKSVDELEKEQALEAAAAKLAADEFGYVADKKAPKSDPIAQMVRTLVSKFRERAKEGEKPAPRSNMDVVTEAILNKQDYMDVWKEARDAALNLIDTNEQLTEEQKEKYKQKVEDSYKRATTFSVSEKRVQQLIRESLKERDISIDNVVRDHYDRKELHKQELIDDLVAKSGLTEEAAKELADVIDNAFQTLMVKKGEALVKKYIKNKDTKRAIVRQSATQKLADFIRLGAFSLKDFQDAFAKGDVFNVMRESLRDRKVSITELVKQSDELKSKEKKAIQDDVISKAGAKDENAIALRSIIDKSFDALMKKKGVDLVGAKVKVKETKKPTAMQKSPIAELIELINIGALESTEFDDLFSDMYGVPNLKEEQKQEIIRRGKKIQKIKSADVRHKEEQKLLSYILSFSDINAAEILTSFWYAHVLSGISTHLRNISDAYISSYLEALNLSGFDTRLIKRAIRARKRGAKGEGRLRFKEAMQTGITPLIRGKFELTNTLERLKVEPVKETMPGILVAKVLTAYINVFKRVPRLLGASDSWMYAGAKESFAEIVTYKDAMDTARALKGKRLTSDEKRAIENEIDKKMRVDKASTDRIKAEVEQESEDYKKIQEQFGEEPTGYSQREKNLRVYEIIDQERGLETTDTAFDLAGRAIGNIKTYGTIGKAVDKLSNLLRSVGWEVYKPEITMRKGIPMVTVNKTKSMKIHPFALVIPFTRIVANVATRNIGWNMAIGAVRGVTGRYGFMLFKDSPYRVEMTKTEKRQVWWKILRIGIFHGILAALTSPDDDGESIITITANGTGNPTKNRQLREDGWRPFAIQIGNWSFDYRQMGGFAMLFMPIGLMRDQQRYTDTELSPLGSYALGTVYSIPLVLATTPLYAITRATEVMGSFMYGDMDMGKKKLTQLVSGMATGFVSPRVFKDIEDTFDVLSNVGKEKNKKNPRSKPETVIAKALQYIPMADMSKGREYYDVFGRPIPTKFTVTQLVDKIDRDEDVQYYLEQDYFRPPLYMRSDEFILYDKKGNMIQRPLNPNNPKEVEQYNKYERTMGQRFHEAVIELRKNKVKGEEFVSDIKSVWSDAMDEAKGDVLDWSETHRIDYDKKALIKE